MQNITCLVTSTLRRVEHRACNYHAHFTTQSVLLHSLVAYINRHVHADRSIDIRYDKFNHLADTDAQLGCFQHPWQYDGQQQASSKDIALWMLRMKLQSQDKMKFNRHNRRDNQFFTYYFNLEKRTNTCCVDNECCIRNFKINKRILHMQPKSARFPTFRTTECDITLDIVNPIINAIFLFKECAYESISLIDSNERQKKR